MRNKVAKKLRKQTAKTEPKKLYDSTEIKKLQLERDILKKTVSELEKFIAHLKAYNESGKEITEAIKAVHDWKP